MEDSVHNFHCVKMAGQAVGPTAKEFGRFQEFLIAGSLLSPTRRTEIYFFQHEQPDVTTMVYRDQS
jgi:hypothetical protein